MMNILLAVGDSLLGRTATAVGPARRTLVNNSKNRPLKIVRISDGVLMGGPSPDMDRSGYFRDLINRTVEAVEAEDHEYKGVRGVVLSPEVLRYPAEARAFLEAVRSTATRRGKIYVFIVNSDGYPARARELDMYIEG